MIAKRLIALVAFEDGGWGVQVVKCGGKVFSSITSFHFWLSGTPKFNWEYR
jgi:hypothetical protein